MRSFHTHKAIFGFSERSDGDLGFINQDLKLAGENWKNLTRGFRKSFQFPSYVHQIHGSNLIDLPSPVRGGLQGKADGMISMDAEAPVGIFTADCLPVLISGDGIIAAIHAGWKSTRENITGKAISRIVEHYRKQVSELFIMMGPCIGPCCLELGNEVPPTFFSQDDSYQSCFTLGKKWHLDLRALNVFQCLNQGVLPGKIKHVNDCTKCQDKNYFSFRGDGERKGSLFSFVIRTIERV